MFQGIRNLINAILSGVKSENNSTGYVINASVKLFFLQGFSLILGFLLNYILVRNIDLDDYGSYIFIFNSFYLASTFCIIGMDTLLVKMVAVYVSTNKFGALKGIVFFTFVSAFLISLVISPFITNLTNYIGLPYFTWFLISTLVLILLSFAALTQSYLRGLKRSLESQLAEKILKPLIIAALVILLSFKKKLTLENLVALNIAASVFVVILNLFFLKKQNPSRHQELKADYYIKHWGGLMLSFFVLNVLYILNSRLDIFVLGMFKGKDQVGIYNIVLKISELVNFGLVAINFIIAPIIARLFEQKQLLQLQKLVTRSAQISLLITIPIALGIIVFREDILRFFSVSLLAGENALVVLILAQVVNVLFGSVGLLLVMTGNHKFSIISFSISILVNVGLSCILTPRYGVIGTAIATTAGIFAWNFTMYLFVRKQLKISTTAFEVL